MSVSEDKVPGEEVGRLKAKDPDLGDNGLVKYFLIDGDGMSVFELSTNSETREAVIKLKKVRGDRRSKESELHFLESGLRIKLPSSKIGFSFIIEVIHPSIFYIYTVKNIKND